MLVMTTIYNWWFTGVKLYVQNNRKPTVEKIVFKIILKW